MITGGLSLALGLLLVVLPSTETVVLTYVPSGEFRVWVNGDELSLSPVPSDSLGILTFTTPELPGPGPATVSIATVEPGPGLICGETER